METDHSSFTEQITKSLFIRIALVSVVLAVLFSLIAIYFERNRISQAVATDAREGAQRFIQQTGALFDEINESNIELLQKKAQAFVDTRRASRLGHFVESRLFDSTGKMLIHITDDEYPNIKAVQNELDTISQTTAPDSPLITKVLRINDQPYLFVSFPLVGKSQQNLGYIRGIFALSKAILKERDSRITRTIFSVILVVFLTALFLYPIVQLLIKRVLKLSRGLLDSNLEIITVLGSAIAKRDSDTDLHNYRVTIYAVKIAEKLGLSITQIQSLIKGSFLHDVGKIGIRDNILLKPGKLDESEFKIMKEHVEHGLDIAKRADWLADAVDVINHHHEKFDGSGYPNGLAGSDIPINARIFAIVDVFDALTSQRPYKAAFTITESLQILEQGRNVHFDPKILDSFNSVANALYGEFAKSDADHLKNVLSQITHQYFLFGASVKEHKNKT